LISFFIFITTVFYIYYIQTLIRLDLYMNRIGDKGAQAIARALEINQVRQK